MSAPTQRTARPLDRDLIDGCEALFVDGLDGDLTLDQRLPWEHPPAPLRTLCPCCREMRTAGEMEPHGLACLYDCLGGVS